MWTANSCASGENGLISCLLLHLPGGQFKSGAIQHHGLLVPEHERSLLWCDPTVGVQWPSVGGPKLAAKDPVGKVLAEVDTFN
jgi:hypothetical protein